LNIPGIGQFSIDPSLSIPEPTDKNFGEFLQSIQFNPKTISRPDEDLIDFIRQKTGKIKPLAESDLDSYLSDCKMVLNIGKPLYFEGIGTLQKNKEGRLDFIHGQLASERLEPTAPERKTEKTADKKPLYFEGIGTLQKNKEGRLDFIHGQLASERLEPTAPERKTEKAADKKPLYNTEYISGQSSSNLLLRRLLMIGGTVIALGVIVWGGYLLYSKKTSPDTDNTADVRQPVQTYIPADSLNAGTADSSTISTPPADSIKTETAAVSTSTPTGYYKFVCEDTRTAKRAFDRFKILKEHDSRFQMETRDSIRYSIFVVLPANAADTTRIKDSLKAWYWGTRDRYIRIAY
jgi:hypothetical protein